MCIIVLSVKHCWLNWPAIYPYLIWTLILNLKQLQVSYHLSVRMIISCSYICYCFTTEYLESIDMNVLHFCMLETCSSLATVWCYEQFVLRCCNLLCNTLGLSNIFWLWSESQDILFIATKIWGTALRSQVAVSLP